MPTRQQLLFPRQQLKKEQLVRRTMIFSGIQSFLHISRFCKIVRLLSARRITLLVPLRTRPDQRNSCVGNRREGNITSIRSELYPINFQKLLACSLHHYLPKKVWHFSIKSQGPNQSSFHRVSFLGFWFRSGVV